MVPFVNSNEGLKRESGVLREERDVLLIILFFEAPPPDTQTNTSKKDLTLVNFLKNYVVFED